MKIAIVQDELIRKGGSEKVVLCLKYAFPQADFYTIAYNPEGTYPEFKNFKIITNWYSKIAQTQKKYQKYFFPLGIIAARMLDLTKYDIVIGCGTHCSKYAKVNKDCLFISYCHTPFRLAWQPESYAQFVAAKGIGKFIFQNVIKILKYIDKSFSKRPDFFIANAIEPKLRIEKIYQPQNPVVIISPPVTIGQYYLSDKPKEYYLIVSRLEFYKKVDLVVNVFNQLGKKLIVVGKGTQEQYLHSIANPNIEFRKGLSGDQLADLYANCIGFLMPQHEDYGITPLEANASGRPVIAFAKGGVLETMIPYSGDENKCSAVFFDAQNEDALIGAINQFETLNFDSNFIRKNAERFDEAIFVEKIKSFVLEKAKERNLY